MVEVKIDNNFCMPKQAHSGEWADLAVAENIDMKSGDFKLIDLGVCIKVPAGYEAIVAPRSSTFKKWGILQANGIGVNDEKYCGDNDKWLFPALAMRDTYIPAGTRIAQFRIQPTQGDLAFNVVDEMSGPDRGGIGSTGN